MNNLPTLENALNSLAPGASWSITYNADGSEYELKWKSKDVKQPTHSEIKEEIDRLAKYWDAQAYKEARSSEYPPLTDLADALYWADKGNNKPLKLYYQKCDAVKKRHPKPTPIKKGA